MEQGHSSYLGTTVQVEHMHIEQYVLVFLNPLSQSEPAGIFPARNGIRQYGRKTTPTDFAPVTAGFLGFLFLVFLRN